MMATYVSLPRAESLSSSCKHNTQSSTSNVFTEQRSAMQRLSVMWEMRQKTHIGF